MVSVLGIWAKLCNIAFQFHSLPSFHPASPSFLPCFLASFLPTCLPTYLPSFLPLALPSFLACLLPLPFLPRSFFPSFARFFLFFLMHFNFYFDASPHHKRVCLSHLEQSAALSVCVCKPWSHRRLLALCMESPRSENPPRTGRILDVPA